MDILRPLLKGAVGTVAQVWEQSKFQMIMRVGKPGKYQMPTQVNRCCGLRGCVGAAVPGPTDSFDTSIDHCDAGLSGCTRTNRQARTRNLNVCLRPAIFGMGIGTTLRYSKLKDVNGWTARRRMEGFDLSRRLQDLSLRRFKRRFQQQ